MPVNPVRRLRDLAAELDGPEAYKTLQLANDVTIALSSHSLDALKVTAEELRSFAEHGRLDVNTRQAIEQIAAGLDEEAEADWDDLVALIEQS